MCRGNRVWIDHWGRTRYKGTPDEQRDFDRGIIPGKKQMEEKITAGKLLYNLSQIKTKVDKKKAEKLNELIFYQQTEDHVSFYAPFGKGECECASDWCKKYCYLKSNPFNKKEHKEIQSINIRNFDINVMPSIIEQSDAKYFTVFSSGSVENLGRNVSKLWGEYLEEIVNRNKNKMIRFLIRNAYEGVAFKDHHKYYIPKLPDNGTIILSLDNSTPAGVLSDALKNKNVKGIAIVNHEDNKKVVTLLKNKILLSSHDEFKVIDCEDCGDKMLCFNQKGRFVLIQKFK